MIDYSQMKASVAVLFLTALKVAVLVQYVQADAIRNSTTEMIQMEGYPVESYYITTSDGYILNIHRIPTAKDGTTNNKSIYLQHCLLCSSAEWIIAGPDKSLGYILADQGYDVWLGNARGNTYSRNHTTLNPDTNATFWNFSWHEIGVIDLPTIIDFILSTTGRSRIYYVGHSQGTTAFYVMGSQRPSYMNKIITYIHLAPVAFMNLLFSPLLRILAVNEAAEGDVSELIGANEFMPSNSFISQLAADECVTTAGALACENVIFAICGFSPIEMNLTLLPTILAHTPAGASTKQLLHYAQEMNSGFFRQYDYGPLKNWQVYGRLTPPSYSLANVTAPGHLFYSSNDWLAAVLNVEQLFSQLGNGVNLFLVSEPTFNHLDFLYGVNASTLIYLKVLDLLASYS